MSTGSQIKLGYEISLDKGTLKPLKVNFWNEDKKFKATKATEPLKYMADAMVGLTLVQLNHFIKSPLHTPGLNYSFAHDAWHQLDPHFELYKRSQERVLSLQSQNRQCEPFIVADFERNFIENLELAQKPWGVDLTLLWPLLESIGQLETKMKSPLLFSFGVKFSKNFTEKLQIFYSFLFHLRSLVAVDHNAHVDDSSHEGVKVDAITDYLPNASYVVNDALLYWSFKKSNASADHPMNKAFHKYSHNACRLVENLPPSFLNSMTSTELEEALYLVQMDWLLGSEAGLLFKIREEIFGLQNGYENIFWTDVEPKANAKAVALTVCCEVSSSHVSKNQAA